MKNSRILMGRQCFDVFFERCRENGREYLVARSIRNPSCGMTGSATFFTTAVLAIRWLFQSKTITAHVHAVAADESGKNNKRPSSRTYTAIMTVEEGNYEHQFFN